MLSYRAVFKSVFTVSVAIALSGCASTGSVNSADEPHADKHALPPLKTHLTLTERQAMAMDLAALYLNYGELKKTKDLLDALRRAKPLHPRVLRLLAGYYIKSGNPGMAMKVLQLMMQKKLAQERDEGLLAHLALRNGQTELAQDIFKKWTRQCKGQSCARAWNNLGWSLFMAGDYTNAKAAFERALSFDPLDERALNNLKLVQAQDQAVKKGAEDEGHE